MTRPTAAEVLAQVQADQRHPGRWPYARLAVHAARAGMQARARQLLSGPPSGMPAPCFVLGDQVAAFVGELVDLVEQGDRSSSSAAADSS